MDGFLSKDFEGEIKEEQDDGQMWMYSKLIFFPRDGFSFITYVQKKMVKLFYA